MADQAAMTLLITLLVIAGVIIIAALLLRWVFVSGNWYSVVGTEIERDIWEAARKKRELNQP